MMKRIVVLFIGFLSFSTGMFAQRNITVTGTITDAKSGMPIPGANIIEQGTSNGVISNFDGEFNLKIPSDAKLEISYLGYKKETIEVDGQKELTIKMKPEAADLDEVVIVGYGTQKKRDLTGAISRVEPDDFSPGINTNATQLLNGAAAGVDVSQVSSAPGGGTKIQIRGVGSINSSTGVLYVVDGLPGVDPNALSPEDIASIDVLKDASAAAIYGTRAANGVVLITTKQGKKGKTQITYSTYTGMQTIAQKIDVLGAANYERLINLRKGKQVYSDADIAGAGEGTNWQDRIFRDAPIQNHQISISGGNDKGNYYVGLNYFDQKGIVKSSSDKKYNLRMNINSNPVKALEIKARMNFTREKRKDILFSNAVNENAGPINAAIQGDPTLPAGLNDEGRYYINDEIALDNPVALIKGVDEQHLFSNFYASLNADYEMIKNFTATVRLGVQANNTRNDSYRSRITQTGLANGGIANVDTQEYTHWLTEYLLKYENTWNNRHHFSVLAGATYERFLNRGLGASSANFLSDITGSNLLQSGDGEKQDNVSSSKVENQLNGFLGRATYGYNNKYLLTASFRVDGSSRFSDKNKYAFFPSASVGWHVSEEDFFKNIDWFNNLKLRAGYGELGNQGINNFETRQTLVAGGNSVFGGSIAQGVVPARLPNPNLKWETTSEFNVGIDFGLLHNRISGSIDVYDRKTKDQLFQKPLPSVVGFSQVRTNFGEVENKGLELHISSKNLTGEFKWNTNFNISFLKNEITKLPEFAQDLKFGNIGTFINNYLLLREGVPLRSFYGYEIDGIFQEGDDIANAPTPNTNDYGPGMPRFVDQNGDGEITDDDRVVLGDPFPDYSFGIKNSFQYKGISLSFFVKAVEGIETLNVNVSESLYPTNSTRNSISKYFIDRWTPENPSNTLPSGVNSTVYGGARTVNSLTIQDASFIRLKNVTLGYNIPVDNSDVFKSFLIYIAGDNLATITDFQGYDPDASANGESVSKVNYNSYPLAKTLLLGLNVKF